MLKKLAGIWGAHWGIITLILAWFLVVLTNFRPGTWLSGWDNLQSELNIGLNISRAFTPAWQEYQGLGLLGGMGHGADLLRVLLLGFLSLFIKTSLLRYVLTFGCLLSGVLGAFKLSHFLSATQTTKMRSIIAFSAGLFYLLNIGTVQNFYAPFEPFYWMYALFPWLLLALFAYLTRPTARRLFFFALVSLLASPMGYLQTAFLVSSIMIGAILSMYCYNAANGRSLLSRVISSLTIIVVIFITNAFWFLPVAYFTLTDSAVTISAQINQIATPEVYLSNQEYGQVWDVVRLRGYWLSLHDYTNNKPQYMMQPWVTYLSNPFIQFVSFVLAGLVLLGVWYGYKKKFFWHTSLILPLFIFVIILIGENPPTGIVMSLFRESIPLLKQIFRSPFTKWIVPGSLLFSLMFGLGVAGLLELTTHVIARKYLTTTRYILTGVIVLFVIIQSLPSFQGNFLYSQLRVTLPDSYLQMFKFFKTQPTNRRVMTLPAHSLWGWNFYDWGLRGSGFIWYGIEQPILDRTFDVWSRYNETFYKEFYSALYSKDPTKISQVIDKYDVSYAILDQSIVTPDKTYSSLNFSSTQELLERMGATVAWKKDKLWVYDLSKINHEDSFVYSPQEFTTSTLDTTYAKYDPQFARGNYIFSNSGSATQFPFASLYKNNITNVQYETDHIQLTQKIQVPQSETLMIPGFIEGDSYIGVAEVSYRDSEVTVNFLPTWKMVLGSGQHSSPQLAPLTIPVSIPPEAIYVEFNGQFVKVAHGETATIQLRNLTVGKNWTLGVIDVNKTVTQDNQVLVGTSDVMSLEVPATSWEPLLNSSSVDVQAGQSDIQLIIPSLATFVDFVSNTYGLDAFGCDIFHRGNFEKYILENTVLYKASNQGASCEGREAPYITTQQSHLLRVSGQNKLGRPLKMYLTNNGENRSDFEFLLPTKEFDSTYPIMSWPLAEARSFAINFENKSFGNEIAENVIKLVEIRSLPLEQLANSWVAPAQEVKTTNSLHVISYSKFFTYFYTVHVQQKTGKDGLLVLSQGYDPGWIAFSNNFISGQFEHVKYNGWANGWLVPPEVNNVTLIFWPQLLSFFGYGLLVITTPLLVYRAWRENSGEKNTSHRKMITKIRLFLQGKLQQK